MNRILLAAAALGLALTGPALAADSAAPAASQPKAPAKAKPAPKPATPHQKAKDEAKGLALATETVEQITQAQFDVSARVLTGVADCEFNQHVSVDAAPGQPGHFHVGFKNVRYTMVPQETTTGAVRLEDRKLGVVWLQIPVKSMMLNSKIGQRMVDGCTHSEQRAAVAAAEAAGRAAAAAEVAAAAARTASSAAATAASMADVAARAANSAASAASR